MKHWGKTEVKVRLSQNHDLFHFLCWIYKKKKKTNSIFHTNNVIPKLVNELSQLKNFREIGSGTTKK